MEPFTLIEESGKRAGPHRLFEDVAERESAKTADHDLQYLAALREANPEMIVTAVPRSNLDLLGFARAGHAVAELDRSTDSFISQKGYMAPAVRSCRGVLAESIQFAKYHYRWGDEDFIVYVVGIGWGRMQYVLKERREGEQPLGPSGATDALIMAAGDWSVSDTKVVWVYDRYWVRDAALYRGVEKATWDRVILDEGMKRELTSAADKFFSARREYEELGVPWKRGLLFHGPPGNGKTISVKALMHTLLLDRADDPIPALYVKSAPTSFDIRNVFQQARRQAPCMLVLEDVETIVTPETRSYFFNEMDGLEDNDGLFVIASTNFLDRLDPGLSKRPSRFDRKYLFPLPNRHERTLYCEYWRRKLHDRPAVTFPRELCPAMAEITHGFSFAFLQEAFVATLLTLAREEDDGNHDNGDDLDRYVLWRTFKQQADILRKEVEGEALTSMGHWGSDVLAPVPSAAPADYSSSTSLPPIRGDLHAMDMVLPTRAADGLHSHQAQLPELPATFEKRNAISSAAFEKVIP